MLDSQYQQQPQRSWAAGGLREPSPEATGGEKLQEEVHRLRTMLAAEQRTSEGFRQELFRVRMELESVLEAKERLLKAKEAHCAALQEKLDQGGSRGRSPLRMSSVSSPTWDGGAGATNYRDQLRQVVAERDELRARVKRFEDFQDELLKSASEVERMKEELQQERSARDMALSNRGCEGNGSWQMNGWDGSVRDGSGRESSWDARGRDSGWDGSVHDTGERSGRNRQDKTGVNRRDRSPRNLHWDASACDHGWDGRDRAGGREGSSNFIKKAPITACGAPDVAEAYIVEDPNTPVPLARSKSSWMEFNSTK